MRRLREWWWLLSDGIHYGGLLRHLYTYWRAGITPSMTAGAVLDVLK